MELKTKINAEGGKQDLWITREFDLPLELLFRAYEESGLVEQWMGTRVVVQESKKYGRYVYETADPKGNIVFQANGVIHEFIPNRQIIRTFEMGNSPFGVQLEVYEFEELSGDTSKLTMHVIYESVDKRDQVLQLPFARGISMAHDRLEDILSKLK